MSTQTDEPLPAPATDYEALVEQFKNLGGPVEAYAQYIQDGIEIEDFAASKAGKILVGRALHASREAIKVILDPNPPEKSVMLAVFELRVQHRLLQSIAGTIEEGRRAQRSLALDEGLDLTGDNPNPDQEDEL